MKDNYVDDLGKREKLSKQLKKCMVRIKSLSLEHVEGLRIMNSVFEG